MTKNFIRKVLNILELDEQNLIELEDYNGNGIYDIKDFVEAPNEKILKYNKGMKFDVILANPPFDNGLGNNFLSKFFDICKGEICSVQPSTWLLGKAKTNAINNIKNNINLYYTNIESINGQEYFDAGISGQMSINYIDMLNKSNDIIFDDKVYSNCNDITLYSNDEFVNIFKKNVTNLYTKKSLQMYIKYVPGLKSHAYGLDLYTENNPDPNWYCVKISAIRGHISSNGTKKSDYYTFITNDKKITLIDLYKNFIHLGNTKQGNKTTFGYYYAFNEKETAVNFLSYLKTDFARLCLYTEKTSTDIVNGCLRYIPWFDFSDPVFSKSPSKIDDYLFAKYIPEVDEETGITRDEIRKHIEKILPDYYNIRK